MKLKDLIEKAGIEIPKKRTRIGDYIPIEKAIDIGYNAARTQFLNILEMDIDDIFTLYIVNLKRKRETQSNWRQIKSEDMDCSKEIN